MRDGETTEKIVHATDEVPRRPQAVRRISGRSPSGIEIKGTAYADPIPGSLDYGPFYGAGSFALSRRGSYVVGNIDFTEIPQIIALLQEVLDAATAPADKDASA